MTPRGSGPGDATAVAHANIALAKYWGKRAGNENLPAVPSLSMTLQALHTETRVQFLPGLSADRLSIDERPRSGRELERVTRLLDSLRAQCGERCFASVTSRNNFPTAAGLASSASGFAALALAASAALGLSTALDQVSSLARAASASAARSAFGGYVALESGAFAALPLLPGEHFPLCMLVTVLSELPKSISSTSAMLHTAQSSPYYPAWVQHAPDVFARVHSGLQQRDIAALGSAIEHSALCMHASMMAADPSVIYLQPQTLKVMSEVRRLREGGMPIYFTMDAGPHVKALTLPEHAAEAEAQLSALPEVLRVIPSSPGPDAHLLS